MYTNKSTSSIQYLAAEALSFVYFVALFFPLLFLCVCVCEKLRSIVLNACDARPNHLLHDHAVDRVRHPESTAANYCMAFISYKFSFCSAAHTQNIIHDCHSSPLLIKLEVGSLQPVPKSHQLEFHQALHFIEYTYGGSKNSLQEPEKNATATCKKTN